MFLKVLNLFEMFGEHQKKMKTAWKSSLLSGIKVEFFRATVKTSLSVWLQDMESDKSIEQKT